jgi:hypothetical protein
MIRALSMVDGQGTPFWVFLIQAFFVVIVAGFALALVFFVVGQLMSWADRKGWMD